MFDKLGIVTNCLARRLAHNDGFENLIEAFVQHGFMHIEIRDGDYLRNSDFGKVLEGLETALQHYSDREWQGLCVAIHDGKSHQVPGLQAREQWSINTIDRLLKQNPDIVLSYAMAHPWTRPPENRTEDDRCIIQAKKIAYLLSPAKARLRLVDMNAKTPLDNNAAVFNLQRYRDLAPECPLALAVENSALPAHEILDLADQSDVHLAYDEANIFYPDGTPMGDPERFWERVTAHRLISVHLKQINHHGVLASLGEGFVDLPRLVNRLSELPHEGDWLLEYQATDQPIQDAIHSREILLTYQKQKGVNP